MTTDTSSSDVTPPRSGHGTHTCKLHVGCGDNYRRGWVNLDGNPGVEPDIVHDLEEPWPFEADRFEHVEAHHVVEHLQDPEFFFCEAARVLKPDGALVVAIPIGINAVTDLDHEHEWTFDTFEQFSREHRRPWDPEVPFDLIARDINIWHEGPLDAFTPITQLLADIYPGQWTSRWPAASGEVIAWFQRCSE